ncbi:MAG TPA: hypothetical protein VIM97_08280 [Actinomycetes bacterium]
MRWHKLPARRRGTEPRADHVNFLLLPWPLQIRASDFRPIEGSAQRDTAEPYGFFDFDPAERLDLDLVDRMLVAARNEVDNIAWCACRRARSRRMSLRRWRHYWSRTV